MFDIVDGLMSMKMDIYRQSEQQDKDTGAITREFSYVKTLDCYSRGIITESRNRSNDNQKFANKYSNNQYVEVRTSERLTPRDKVKNIRDAEGNSIWYELNYPSDTPTVFDIIGTTPIADPFGNVVGYNSSLQRAENQQIGI
jgi:hypothetical protein